MPSIRASPAPGPPAALRVGEHPVVVLEFIPVEQRMDLDSGAEAAGHQLEMSRQLVGSESSHAFLADARAARRP